MSEPEAPRTLNINQIREILPHRYPFLMIDRVIELDIPGKWLVAIKNVTANEPQFLGHFPVQPVMPGVLVIEAMAQASAIYILSLPENKGRLAFFTGVESAKFRRKVGPGDQMRLECTILRTRGRVGKSAVRCLVDGDLAAEATLTCVVGDAE